MQFFMAWTMIAATLLLTLRLLRAPGERRYCELHTRPRKR